MICCYLLHSRQFTNADAALNYYGQARTQDKKGVTIPSQLRYVNYYAKIVQEHLTYSPVTLYIKEIVLEPLPCFTSGQGSICFSLSKATGACKKNQRLYKSLVYELKRGQPKLSIPLDACTPLTGDVKIEVYNKKIVKEKLLQFWFNTFFVRDERECDMNGFADNKNGDCRVLVLRLTKKELDIVNKKDNKHKMFSSDFTVSPRGFRARFQFGPLRKIYPVAISDVLNHGCSNKVWEQKRVKCMNV